MNDKRKMRLVKDNILQLFFKGIEKIKLSNNN